MVTFRQSKLAPYLKMKQGSEDKGRPSKSRFNRAIPNSGRYDFMSMLPSMTNTARPVVQERMCCMLVIHFGDTVAANEHKL